MGGLEELIYPLINNIASKICKRSSFLCVNLQDQYELDPKIDCKYINIVYFHKRRKIIVFEDIKINKIFCVLNFY